MTESAAGDNSARPVVAGYDGRPQGRDALALGAALAEKLAVPLIVASACKRDLEAARR